MSNSGRRDTDALDARREEESLSEQPLQCETNNAPEEIWLFRSKFSLGTLGFASIITLLFTLLCVSIPGLLFLLVIPAILPGGKYILFLFVISPILFVFIFGARIVSRWTGGGYRGALAGMTVMADLFAAVPLYISLTHHARMRAIAATDHDDGTRPAAGGVIAVRQNDGDVKVDHNGEIACDGLCQRLLLTGVARQVLLVAEDISLPVDPEAQASSFRMEKRPSCPAIDRRVDDNDVIAREAGLPHDGGAGEFKTTSELLRIEIAKGNCLIVETAPLRSADMILSFGLGHDGSRETYASQSIMHEKNGDAFKETFRRTYSRAEGFWSTTYPGLYRTAFLTERLGYDLALQQDNVRADLRMLLTEAMTRPAIDAITVEMAGVFTTDLARDARNDKLPQNDDLELIWKLLADEKFPVIDGLSTLVAHAADSATQEQFDAIGTLLFKRLRALAEGVQAKAGPYGWNQKSAIIDAIGKLPRDTILKHRDGLEWLARQDVYGEAALDRMPEFGASAGPTLLWLIDDAHRVDPERYDWRRSVGLNGLCKLGGEAVDMLSPLQERFESGMFTAGEGERAVKALIAMGADPDVVWRRIIFLYYKKPFPFGTRAGFDKMVARMRAEPDCN